MKTWFGKIIGQFRNTRAFAKVLCDIVLTILICLLVFWVLPQKVTFFDLASTDTRILAKVKHIGVALCAIFLFRSFLLVYNVQWHATTAYQCLTVVVADMMAGITYYFVTDILLGSTYPFLLTVTLFALIDILTLFIRLGYRGLCDEYSSLRRNDVHLTAKEKEEGSNRNSTAE